MLRQHLEEITEAALLVAVAFDSLLAMQIRAELFKSWPRKLSIVLNADILRPPLLEIAGLQRILPLAFLM